MGGGIFNYGGSLTLTNSTLSDNTAQGGSGANNGSGFGGAIFNLNGTVAVTFSTLAANVASTGGGVIYNLGDNGVATQSGPALPHTTATVLLVNSILAGSTNGSGLVSDLVTNTNASDGVHSGTQATSGDHNLIQTDPGNFAGTNTLTSNPLLGPLQNNGGPTQTLALTSSSPAFQAGVPVMGVTSDQRGLPRAATTPSLGAFEPQITTMTTANSATAIFGATSVTLKATVTSGGVGVPEGTVTFTIKQGITVIGTAASTSNFDSNGNASVSYALPASTAAGTYTVDAVYNPGSDFVASSDTTHTLTIAPAAASIQFTNVTIVPNLLALNQTETIAVHISGPGGVNQGTVAFTVDGHSVSAAVNANGDATASLTLPLLTAASPQSINAVFNGPNRSSANATQTAIWELVDALLPSVATFAANDTQSVQSYLMGLPLWDFLYSSSGRLTEVVFGPDWLSWDFSYFDGLTVVTLDDLLPVMVSVSTP